MKVFSLQNKILLTILPVIIISLCTVTYVFYNHAKLAFIDNKLSDVENYAIQQSTTIDMWFNLLSERLQNVARTTQVRQTLLNNAPIATSKSTLLNILGLPQVDLIWCEVISPNGLGQRYILDSPQEYSTIYVDVRQTDYYKRLSLGRDTFFVTPSYTVTPSGYPIVTASAIVPDQDGNMTGFISIGVQMSETTYNTMKLYQKEILPFVLFDTNDRPFFFSSADLAEASEVISSAKYATQYYSKQFSYEWDGHKKLAYQRPMPFTHWSLALILDEDQLFNTLYTFLQSIIITAIISLCLAIIVILFLAKWLTNPLTEFESAISRVSTGDLSLHSIPVHSQDEIGRLARSFEYMVTNLRKIREERDSIQDEIRLSEEKFSKAFRSIPSLISLTSLEDGRYLEVNDAIYTIFGFNRVEVIGLTSAQVKLWESETAREEFAAAIRKNGYVRNYMIKHCKKSGERLLGSLSAEIIQIHDKKCIISCWTDITALKAAEEELRYLGTHDTLTGVHNRAYLKSKALELAADAHSKMGIILFDVDGLKLINDTLGHTSGDKMLVATANIIKESAGSEAVVARIGGDEFIVLLPSASQEQLAAICRTITEKTQQHPLLTENIYLSISMGYASAAAPKANLETLFAEADGNMYRDKLRHSQSARNAIVHTLIKRITSQNLFTAYHQEDLERLAVELAKACGLSQQRIAEIRLLTKFRDIGNISIPDYILQKPASLTKDERQDLERHTEIGHRVALSAPELVPIADWILKHHEWWNGCGYPLGLRGEEIPIECRIMAIIDAYTAMTSHRPYREALSTETAANELQRCAGTQFDPHLVELFIKRILAKTSL